MSGDPQNPGEVKMPQSIERNRKMKWTDTGRKLLPLDSAKMVLIADTGGAQFYYDPRTRSFYKRTRRRWLVGDFRP